MGSESRERLYQDLAVKLVSRCYDTIATSVLQNLSNEPSTTILEQLLQQIGGRIMSWMYTRANPQESALVYAKLDDTLKEYIESCEPQANKPIVASSLSILDFLTGAWPEKEHFCTGMASVVRLIVDEELDPLAK